MLATGFSKGGVGEYYLVNMDLCRMVVLLVIHHTRYSPSVRAAQVQPNTFSRRGLETSFIDG